VRRTNYVPPFKGGQGRKTEEITSTAGVLSVLGVCVIFWALLWWSLA
jgi:hypothetical protein